MPESFNRFEIHLTKLREILLAIPPNTDSALTFYKSPARQYLFYLEALTHIYKKMHNHKRFERMRISFKSLEDQLGKIDYYDAFVKEFTVQENFPVDLLHQLSHHYTDELNVLDALLKKNGWIDEERTALKTIEAELQDADWEPEMKDRKEAGGTLIQEIEQIKSYYYSGKLNFKDIEHGVHEFRRQVRWISIYAQALNGLIQLKQVDIPDPRLSSYLTKEVLESPFNRMPPLPEGMLPIYIEAPGFYALSWLIAESGKLKDEGLRIICIEDIMRETGYVKEEQIKPIARSLAVKSTSSLKQIKEKMKIIADRFMHDDRILDRIGKDIRQSIGG